MFSSILFLASNDSISEVLISWGYFEVSLGFPDALILRTNVVRVKGASEEI